MKVALLIEKIFGLASDNNQGTDPDMLARLKSTEKGYKALLAGLEAQRKGNSPIKKEPTCD